MQIQIDPMKEPIQRQSASNKHDPVEAVCVPRFSEASTFENCLQEFQTFKEAFTSENWIKKNETTREQWRLAANEWVNVQERHYEKEAQGLILWAKQQWRRKGIKLGSLMTAGTIAFGWGFYGSMVDSGNTPSEVLTSVFAFTGFVGWVVGSMIGLVVFWDQKTESLDEIGLNLGTGKQLIKNNSEHQEQRRQIQQRFECVKKIRSVLSQEQDQWFRSQETFLQAIHEKLKKFNVLQAQEIQHAWKKLNRPSYLYWTEKELDQWMDSVILNSVQKAFFEAPPNTLETHENAVKSVSTER